MLHRLILKANKFQRPPLKRLSTVVRNSLGGASMSNRIKFTEKGVKNDVKKL